MTTTSYADLFLCTGRYLIRGFFLSNDLVDIFIEPSRLSCETFCRFVIGTEAYVQVLFSFFCLFFRCSFWCYTATLLLAALNSGKSDGIGDLALMNKRSETCSINLSTYFLVCPYAMTALCLGLKYSFNSLIFTG